MIAALSLIKRRPDVSADRFRRHWLDPHGVLAAQLPGVTRYVQNHTVEACGTLAERLDIAGFAELWFDSADAQKQAYSSPKIRECDKDSELFIGAVSSVVTEPEEILATDAAVRKFFVLLVGEGGGQPDWADRMQAWAAQAGAKAYIAHRIISQAGAPGSQVASFDAPVAGVAEISFAADGCPSTSAMTAAAHSGRGEPAVYEVVPHRLVG